MKKCHRCSKPATLHITDIHDGKAAAVHFCNNCAKEYLEDEKDQPGNVPSPEFAAELEALVAEDEGKSQRCSNCDISFGEFREKGRLGCPTCYEEFRNDLLPLLENIHEEVMHFGKRPRRTPGDGVDQNKLIQLRHRQKESY